MFLAGLFPHPFPFGWVPRKISICVYVYIDAHNIYGYVRTWIYVYICVYIYTYRPHTYTRTYFALCYLVVGEEVRKDACYGLRPLGATPVHTLNVAGHYSLVGITRRGYASMISHRRHHPAGEGN